MRISEKSYVVSHIESLIVTKILNKLSTYYDSITGFGDKETIVTQLKYMKLTLRNSQGICSSKKDCLTL